MLGRARCKSIDCQRWATNLGISRAALAEGRGFALNHGSPSGHAPTLNTGLILIRITGIPPRAREKCAQFERTAPQRTIIYLESVLSLHPPYRRSHNPEILISELLARQRRVSDERRACLGGKRKGKPFVKTYTLAS